MTLELKLNDDKINLEMNLLKRQYNTLFNYQQAALEGKFNSNGKKNNLVVDSIQKASMYFGATYRAINSAVNDELKKGVSAEGYNAFLTSAAALATVKYMGGNTNQNISNSDKIYFDYQSSESAIIPKVVEGVTNTAINTRNKQLVDYNIADYYNRVGNSSLDYLKRTNEKLYKKLETLQLISESMDIKPFKKIELPQIKSVVKSEDEVVNVSKLREKYAIPPKKLNPEKNVTYDDVINNTAAKNALRKSIGWMGYYDLKRRYNPVMEKGGFKQLYLFVGEPATGKTMLANYAICTAKNWYSRLGIPFQASELDIKTDMQAGPQQLLEFQLNYVVNTNMLQILVIDEMESKFPDRKGIRQDTYINEIITELLNFTEGLSYPNPGNYIIIGASNYPDRIDPAIRSRFKKGTFLIEPPTDPDDLATIIQNNLLPVIGGGGVAVKNWNDIGLVAKELDLKPRDLVSVATDLMDDIKEEDFSDKTILSSYENKSKALNRIKGVIDDKMLLEKMYFMASTSDAVKKAAKLSGSL